MMNSIKKFINSIYSSSFFKEKTLFKVKGIPITLNFTLKLLFILFFSAVILNPEDVIGDKPSPIILNVYLDFLIFSVIVGLAIVSYLLVTITSILLHEFGHVYVMRKKDIKVDKIVLSALGGAAVIDSDNENKLRDNPKAELRIALAGPTVTAALLLCGSVFKIFFDFNFLNFFVNINGIILVLNLVPIYPLDGGRVLRSVFHKFFLKDEAERVTHVIALVLFLVGGTFSVINKHYGFVLVSLLLGITNIYELMHVPNPLGKRCKRVLKRLKKSKDICLIIACIEDIQKHSIDKKFCQNTLCRATDYLCNNKEPFDSTKCPLCYTHSGLLCTRYFYNVKKIIEIYKPANTEGDIYSYMSLLKTKDIPNAESTDFGYRPV